MDRNSHREEEHAGIQMFRWSGFLLPHVQHHSADWRSAKLGVNQFFWSIMRQRKSTSAWAYRRSTMTKRRHIHNQSHPKTPTLLQNCTARNRTAHFMDARLTRTYVINIHAQTQVSMDGWANRTPQQAMVLLLPLLLLQHPARRHHLAVAVLYPRSL